MIYALHDAAAASLLPARAWARAASTLLRATPGPEALTWGTRAVVAWADVANDVQDPPRRGGGAAGNG